MQTTDVLPDIKQIVGALLFAAKQPLSLAEIRRVLKQVAESRKDAGRDFAGVSESELAQLVAGLKSDLDRLQIGIRVMEVAHGYRLVNDTSCGPWLRQYLNRAKPSHLSRPALETLAIIAYRQPCTRAEIESVRGVDVDQMVRNLLELQLVRIAGRSELPGRPWLLTTTQKFLEYFGLKNLDDLPGADELRRMEAEQLKRRQNQEQATAAAPAAASAPGPGSAEGFAKASAAGEEYEVVDEDDDEGEDEENEGEEERV